MPLLRRTSRLCIDCVVRLVSFYVSAVRLMHLYVCGTDVFLRFCRSHLIASDKYRIFFTEVADSRFFDSLDFPLVVLVLLPVLILFLDSTTYYKCESPSRYVTIDSDRKTYI